MPTGSELTSLKLAISHEKWDMAFVVLTYEGGLSLLQEQSLGTMNNFIALFTSSCLLTKPYYAVLFFPQRQLEQGRGPTPSRELEETLLDFQHMDLRPFHRNKI
jgi:hypothetical protein